MGRPQKSAAGQEVRERLIAAMADRLICEPVDAVTVASLIQEVGCNRSTFYYHFANIEQLAEAALDAVVPVEIPQALLSFVRQGTSSFGPAISLSPDASPSIPALVQRNSQGIDTLCAVLNGPNAALAQKRVKQRLLEDVLPDLSDDVSLNANDPTFRIVFEYAAGGVLALMAYRAETGFVYPVETFLQCLAPEIPAALLNVLSGKHIAFSVCGDGGGFNCKMRRKYVLQSLENGRNKLL